MFLPLIDLLTTAQGYLQLFNEQPPKASYETKLRQAIGRLDAALQESVVQTLLSSQVTGWPLHTPALHVSPLVQALPSSQAPGAGV